MGPDTLLPSAPRQQRGHSRTFPTRREASRRLGVRPAAATWLPARIADAKRCQSRKSDGKDGRTAAVAGYLRGIASAASEIRRRRALPRKFLTATGSAASLTSAFRRASDLPSALLTATGVRLRLSAGFPAGVPPPRAFLTATATRSKRNGTRHPPAVSPAATTRQPPRIPDGNGSQPAQGMRTQPEATCPQSATRHIHRPQKRRIRQTQSAPPFPLDTRKRGRGKSESKRGRITRSA